MRTLKRLFLSVLAVGLVSLPMGCSDAPGISNKRAGNFITAEPGLTFLAEDLFTDECALAGGTELQISIENLPKADNEEFPPDAAEMMTVRVERVRLEFFHIGEGFDGCDRTVTIPTQEFTATAVIPINASSNVVVLPLSSTYKGRSPLNSIGSLCNPGAAPGCAFMRFHVIAEVTGRNLAGEKLSTRTSFTMEVADYGN